MTKSLAPKSQDHVDRACGALEVAYGLIERAAIVYVAAAHLPDEKVTQAIGAAKALLADAVERLREPSLPPLRAV
jgi:hypothetical protein